MRLLCWLLSFRRIKKMKPEGIGYRDLWVSNDPPEPPAKVQTMPTNRKPIYQYPLDCVKSLFSGLLHGWRAVLSGLIFAVEWLLEARAFYFFCMIACIIGIGRLADIGDLHNASTRLGGQIALGIMAAAALACTFDPSVAKSR